MHCLKTQGTLGRRSWNLGRKRMVSGCCSTRIHTGSCSNDQIIRSWVDDNRLQDLFYQLRFITNDPVRAEVVVEGADEARVGVDAAGAFSQYYSAFGSCMNAKRLQRNNSLHNKEQLPMQPLSSTPYIHYYTSYSVPLRSGSFSPTFSSSLGCGRRRSSCWRYCFCSREGR